MKHPAAALMVMLAAGPAAGQQAQQAPAGAGSSTAMTNPCEGAIKALGQDRAVEEVTNMEMILRPSVLQMTTRFVFYKIPYEIVADAQNRKTPEERAQAAQSMASVLRAGQDGKLHLYAHVPLKDGKSPEAVPPSFTMFREAEDGTCPTVFADVQPIPTISKARPPKAPKKDSNREGFSDASFSRGE